MGPTNLHSSHCNIVTIGAGKIELSYFNLSSK
jgi:hypothetical protein